MFKKSINTYTHRFSGRCDAIAAIDLGERMAGYLLSTKR